MGELLSAAFDVPENANRAINTAADRVLRNFELINLLLLRYSLLMHYASEPRDSEPGHFYRLSRVGRHGNAPKYSEQLRTGDLKILKCVTSC